MVNWLRWQVHFSLILFNGPFNARDGLFVLHAACCMAGTTAPQAPREAEFRETSAGEVVPLRLPDLPA